MEDLVLAELNRLAAKPVDGAELKRVQQQIIAQAVFSRESVHGLADSIAQGVTTNDLDFLKNYLPRILASPPKMCRKPPRSTSIPIRASSSGPCPKRAKAKANQRNLPTGRFPHSVTPSPRHPVTPRPEG